MRAPPDPDPSDFNDALARIAEYINTSGREIHDEIEEETEDGIRHEGFIFSHGENTLVAVGVQDNPYFHIQFESDVVENATNGFAIAEALESADPEEGEEVEVEKKDRHREKAEQYIGKLIEGNSDENLMDLYLQIQETLTQPNTMYDIDQEQMAPVRFNHKTRLFVYDDRTGYTEFENACQAALGPGILADRTLNKAFQLHNIADETITEDAPEPGSQRRYQY